MIEYAKPYSIHGTPDEQERYRARVRALDKGRGQTCPSCDATDSHLLQWVHGAAYYECDNCGRYFYG